MIFKDARQGAHRAATVSALLDPGNGWVTHNAVITLTEDRVTFDAAKWVLWWRDADGEQRHLLLPSGITAEALSGLMDGLRQALTPWPLRAPMLAGWPDPDARPVY